MEFRSEKDINDRLLLTAGDGRRNYKSSHFSSNAMACHLRSKPTYSLQHRYQKTIIIFLQIKWLQIIFQDISLGPTAIMSALVAAACARPLDWPKETDIPMDNTSDPNIALTLSFFAGIILIAVGLCQLGTGYSFLKKSFMDLALSCQILKQHITSIIVCYIQYFQTDFLDHRRINNA